MTLIDYTPHIATAVASFLGAWLAARFALSRFYKEKTWERKTIAYTNIFETLHDMSLWSKEHKAYLRWDNEPDSEIEKKLGDDYLAAKARLERQLARETWLLRDAFHKRVALLLSVLARRDHASFYEMVAHDDEALAKATTDLRVLVQRDLRLDPRLWIFR
jgi:hypothetical protein